MRSARKPVTGLVAATPFGILLATAVFLTTVTGAPVWAHAPEQHGFRITTFQRPATAPRFTLSTPQGRTRSLEDFRGKVVLLNFWATWCPPCVKEMPSMEKLYQSLQERDFVVVAISLDEGGAAKVNPFLERLGLTFPILLDPEGRVSATYGARDLPSSFLLDRKGQVIAAAKGERDWFSQGAQSYVEEVLAKASKPKNRVAGQ